MRAFFLSTDFAPRHVGILSGLHTGSSSWARRTKAAEEWQLGKLLVNVASIVATNDRLLKHLKRDSEWLQQQLGQYGPISSDL